LTPESLTLMLNDAQPEVISSLSLEYVQVVVQVTAGAALYDPTGDEVQFAFVNGSAYPSAWYTGGWTTNLQGSYIAECLVGPAGTVTLTPAIYTVWVKITDDPEIPVRTAGTVTIT
jgi:hypothetical protein